MKLRVGLFFGGESVEHEISVISALQAARFMNEEKYEIIPVYLSKKGEFYTGAPLLQIEQFRNIPKLLSRCRRILISREGDEVVLYDAEGGLRRRKPLNRLDFAFPVVHGTHCEDGTLQGYFELLGLPYAGCDLISSALGMDKIRFKTIAAAAGLPVLPCVAFTSREWVADRDGILKKLTEEIGYPMIVKPANLGSSVGISKVENEEELIEAVSLASSFAGRLLCEHAIEALREINCSVLGDEQEAAASVCEEPVMSDRILSYLDKYQSKEGSKGMASLKRRLPAELGEEKAEEIRSLALRAFQALGCSGVIRIDFLMDTADSDRVYINEINTIPGSLAFYLWEATGMKYQDLLDRMIELGLRRKRNNQSLMYTYDSNVLESGTPFGTKKHSGKLRG